MIYAYKHLKHRIEDFHINIAYFFEQLFTHDPAAYDESTLLKSEFIPIVNRSPSTLRSNLEKITIDYHALKDPEKQKIKEAFTANSDIRILCEDVNILPVKYDALPEDIRETLKNFLTKLWEDYPLNQLLEAACGTVQEHFDAFVSETHQCALICPFCGLHGLKPSGSINRDAYDHYIPKALYPFISINFQNLFPICHECNSDEKKATDTLYEAGVRRPVFFPFDETFQSSELLIAVTPEENYNQVSYKTLLSEIKWSYAITLSGKDDERIRSWDAVFRIKRRYKEKILRYQLEWYDEVVRLYRRERKKGTSFTNFKKEVIEETEYQKLISPLGILRHSYFQFLLASPDIESKLEEEIQRPKSVA